MSIDGDESQATPDDSGTEKTIITTEADSGKEGPQPLYKEDDVDKPDEDSATEEDPEDKKSDGEDNDSDEEKPEEKETKEYDSLDKPEDSLLSDADMERILSKAKEEGLSKEAAQKQVESADGVLKSSSEDLDRRHNELSESWIQECKDDEEIGGDKFSESVDNARKALKKFAPPELLVDLNKTKFGNNPNVIKTFARIGKAMSPDELIKPGVNSGGERSLEDVFYGGNKT